MDITEKASDFAHETSDKIGRAAEALGDKADHLKKTEQRLMKDCCRYISDKPLTAMGIAIVSGFLLSRVLSGR